VRGLADPGAALVRLMVEGEVVSEAAGLGDDEDDAEDEVE
jgi:hypothetical protein